MNQLNQELSRVNVMKNRKVLILGQVRSGTTRIADIASQVFPGSRVDGGEPLNPYKCQLYGFNTWNGCRRWLFDQDTQDATVVKITLRQCAMLHINELDYLMHQYEHVIYTTRSDIINQCLSFALAKRNNKWHSTTPEKATKVGLFTLEESDIETFFQAYMFADTAEKLLAKDFIKVVDYKEASLLSGIELAKQLFNVDKKIEEHHFKLGTELSKRLQIMNIQQALKWIDKWSKIYEIPLNNKDLDLYGSD